MVRIRPFLMLFFIVVGVGIVSGTAVADDEWTGKCDNAEEISPGAYSGTLSPEDQDSFVVEIPQGDYINVRLEWENENLTGIQFMDDAFKYGGVEYEHDSHQESTRDMEGKFSSASILYNGKGRDAVTPSPSDMPFETRVYSEGDGPVCLGVLAYEGAGDWKMSFSIQDEEPPALVDQHEAREIENEIEELESLLEQKNQTISELNSNSSNSDIGGVDIDVTINPGNGQENFVEGGKAVIKAESENADISEMYVEYRDGIFQFDSSGKTIVPLSEIGTQELTLVYGNATEQASIDVQSRGDQASQNPQNQEDENPTEMDGSGLGVVAVMIALIGGMLLLSRYR